MITRLSLKPRERRTSPENPSTSLSNPDSWLYDAFGATRSSTGVAVNERSAMRVLAVFACVRIIAETVASLPLITYRRLARGKERATDHPLYALLHDRPNPEMPSMTFRETLEAHVLVWGNAYAEIETNKAGTVIGLWPLLPDRTRSERINGQRIYKTTLPNGVVAVLSADRVFHVPGLGFDGLSGYSPIQMAKNAIGLTAAVEEYGASFFGRGTTPAGVLKHPKALSDPARKHLRESWELINSGLTGAHRVALLEEGMEWQQLGIPPDHAQFLETRKFQLAEIARLYRVPPHMVGDLESGASYASVEQMSLDFVTYTLRPWLVRWEQAMTTQLLGAREQAALFVEHLVDGLLRGDIKSRYEAYAIGRQWGWLSGDDVREIENMNPLPDGQGAKYILPVNFVPADQLGQTPPAPAATPPSEPQANSQRAAYVGLFRDIGDRMVKREAPQLRKLLKQPESGWTQGVDALYREHLEHFTKAVQPAFDALILFGPLAKRSLSQASRALAGDLVSSELTLIRAALDSAGYVSAAGLVTTWEAHRAEQFAERAADFLTNLLTTADRRVA